MNKTFLILLTFLFFGFSCTSTSTTTKLNQYNFEDIFFDTVSKQLFIEQSVPDNLQIVIDHWFNKNIKVNGFDGTVEIKLDNYKEEISNISDGKRVDLSLNFSVIIMRSEYKDKTEINGEVNSFSTITGQFSLNQVDNLIESAQIDLVYRLNKVLKSRL